LDLENFEEKNNLKNNFLSNISVEEKCKEKKLMKSLMKNIQILGNVILWKMEVNLPPLQFIY